MDKGEDEVMRKGLIIALVLVVGYVGVVPAFWPKPTISISYPAAAHIGEDLEVTIRMSAWHMLFDINGVRIAPDVYQSSAITLSDPLYPIQLLDVAPRRYGWAHRFLRFTWPVTKEKKVKIALSEEPMRGKLSEGDLVGKIDINYTRATYSMRGMSSMEETHTQPFRITLAPARENDR